MNLQADVENREAAAYLKSARKYAGNHQYIEAIAFYSEAIKCDPTLINAYYERAMCRELVQDFDGAIEDYEKYLVLGRTLFEKNAKEVKVAIEQIDANRASGGFVSSINRFDPRQNLVGSAGNQTGFSGQVNNTPNAKYVLVNSISLVCGIVGLIAFIVLPWFPFLGSWESGFQVAIQSKGLALTVWLVPIACIRAVYIGSWGLRDYTKLSESTVGALIAGIVGIIYFLVFYYQSALSLITSINIIGLLGSGFWLALLAVCGLLFQPFTLGSNLNRGLLRQGIDYLLGKRPRQ